MNRSKKIAEYALYTALAFLFGYLENLFPLPLPFPGMKIGFANLIFVLILYKKGFRYTLSLSLLRIVLSAFTFGSLFSLLYSLVGSVLSLMLMAGLLNAFRQYCRWHSSLHGTMVGCLARRRF